MRDILLVEAKVLAVEIRLSKFNLFDKISVFITKIWRIKK